MMTATPHQTPHTDGRSLARLALKTGVLFLILNVVFAWLNPLPALGRVSAYNFSFLRLRHIPRAAVFFILLTEEQHIIVFMTLPGTPSIELGRNKRPLIREGFYEVQKL